MAKIIVNNPRQVINGGAKKYYFKVKGLGGPKGDQGVKGDPGSRGPQGEPGNAATVYVGSTTTLPVGQDATVENVGTQYNAVLNFGIPQGPRGPQGVKGDPGEPGQKGEPGPRGVQGERGTNATVYVGTTSTLNPGTQATVYNSGTDSNAVLNFGIPRGEKGETGATGATGATGPAGQNFTPTIVDSLPATGNQSNLYLTPKNYTTGTATGNPITISIGEEAGQISSAQLDGNTTQQTYTGKNLFNIGWNKVPSGGNNSVDFTTTNGSLEITQTGANGNGSVSVGLPSSLLGKTLTLSVSSISLDGSSGARIRLTNQNGGDVSSVSWAFYPTDGNLSKTFSLPSELPTGVTSFRLYFYVNASNIQGSVGAKVGYNQIQIEEGSTATAYEPYVGGVASPNPDYPQAVNTVTGEQTVGITGKNLLKITGVDLNGVKTTLNADGSISCVGKTATNYFSITSYQSPVDKVIPAGTYTYSRTGDKTRTLNCQLWNQDKSNYVTARMDAGVSNNSVTVPFDIYYFNVACTQLASGTDIDFTTTLQLEAGSTATSFAPYNKQTLPIDLGSIELCKLGDYQDYIYKDGDSWKVHKVIGKHIFDGSEDFSIDDIYNNIAQFRWKDSSVIKISDQYVVYTISDNFRGVQYSQSWTANNAITAVNGHNALRFMTSASTTVDSFQEWLGTHNTKAYYVLATPSDTTITDQTLIAQLEAVRNATLQASNTITNTATGSNLAGDLELGYCEYDPHNRYNKWLWLDINNNYEQLGN